VCEALRLGDAYGRRTYRTVLASPNQPCPSHCSSPSPFQRSMAHIKHITAAYVCSYKNKRKDINATAPAHATTLSGRGA